MSALRTRLHALVRRLFGELPHPAKVRRTAIMAEVADFDSRRPGRLHYWAELWQARELLLVFVQRDVSVRYRQTALGVLWVAVQPIGMMLIFTLIFGRWVRVDTGEVPYHLFVLCGLLPWHFFAAALSATSSSVTHSQALISKVYFPRLIIPIAAAGAPLVDSAVAFLLLLVFLLASGASLTPMSLWLPLIMVIALLIAIGIGCFIAALTVRYRDFHHLLPFVITAWMFLTPIVYPPTLVPAEWQWLIALNPVAGVIVNVRAVLLDLPPEPALLASSGVAATLFCWLGARYFRRQEMRFADVI